MKSSTSNIVILGSTGSVGTQALEVAGKIPERVRVVGLAADRNTGLMKKQIECFRPRAVAMANAAAAKKLRGAAGGARLKIYEGEAGLEKLARLPEADAVLVATSGISGLAPTLAAIEAGKRVLTSNKESIAAAGALIVKTAKKHHVEILPVDSEHSAVFQLLRGLDRNEIRRVILTASGGPFLNRKNLAGVTPEQALAHPRWNMGRKTSVDSATMMNKGLELLEAAALFSLRPDQLDVAVHPQSLAHAMVELADGNVLAHLAVTDMKMPLRYAMTYPERLPAGETARLPLSCMRELTFLEPDEKKFPCLGLARAALSAGGAAPAALSAADEIAVEAFLRRKIKFTDIPAVAGNTMAAVADMFPSRNLELDEILEADSAARRRAAREVRGLSVK